MLILMSISHIKVYFFVFISLFSVWIRISVFEMGAQSTPMAKRSIYRGVTYWSFWIRIVTMVFSVRKAIRIITDISGQCAVLRQRETVLQCLLEVPRTFKSQYPAFLRQCFWVISKPQFVNYCCLGSCKLSTHTPKPEFGIFSQPNCFLYFFSNRTYFLFSDFENEARQPRVSCLICNVLWVNSLLMLCDWKMLINIIKLVIGWSAFCLVCT